MKFIGFRVYLLLIVIKRVNFIDFLGAVVQDQNVPLSYILKNHQKLIC